MKKSYLWRKMTSGLMAAAVTVTAMPGLGLTMVQAEEKKTLKVAMECSYAHTTGHSPMIPTEQFRFPEALITHMATML